MQQSQRAGILRTWFDNGMTELFIGAAILSMGVSLVLSDTGLWESDATSGILMMAAFIGWEVLLHRVVKPRTGQVRFSVPVRRRIGLTIGLAVLINAVVLFLGILSLNGSGTSGGLLVQISGLIWIPAFTIAGILLGVPRLAFYGLLVSPLLPLRGFLRIIPGMTGYSVLPFFLSAGIFLLIGVWYLSRFISETDSMPSFDFRGHTDEDVRS